MLQGEHSAILSTFIKLLVVIKTFALSIFEWLFYTGIIVKVEPLDIVEHAGFALGFIFLSPPFSPIRFFLCHFFKLRARFLTNFRQKKEPGFLGILRKKSLLSLTPLILVDYSIHIDTITMG